MEIQLECECDHSIDEFTRGSTTELDTLLSCDDCGQVYAVSVTALGRDGTGA